MQVYLSLVLLPTIVLAQKGMYKVWLEKLTECESGQAPLFDLSSLKVSHYNHTIMNIKGDAKVLAGVTSDSKMRIMAFQKNAYGSWTKAMLDSKVTSVCEHIEKDDYFWPSMVKISNLPNTCPINEGVYHFKDVALTLERLPPMVPLGCFKLVFTAWSGELKSCSNAFVKVTGPKDSPGSRCT